MTKNRNNLSNIQNKIPSKNPKNAIFDTKYEAEDNANIYNLTCPSNARYDKSINPIANKKMRSIIYTRPFFIVLKFKQPGFRQIISYDATIRGIVNRFFAKHKILSTIQQKKEKTKHKLEENEQ